MHDDSYLLFSGSKRKPYKIRIELEKLLITAAVINIFIMITDQMTFCNGKMLLIMTKQQRIIT